MNSKQTCVVTYAYFNLVLNKRIMTEPLNLNAWNRIRKHNNAVYGQYCIDNFSYLSILRLIIIYRTIKVYLYIGLFILFITILTIVTFIIIFKIRLLSIVARLIVRKKTIAWLSTREWGIFTTENVYIPLEIQYKKKEKRRHKVIHRFTLHILL